MMMVHGDGYVMKSESQFQYIQYEIKRTGPLRCYVSRSIKRMLLLYKYDIVILPDVKYPIETWGPSQ